MFKHPVFWGSESYLPWEVRSRTSGREFWGLVMEDEGDGILVFLTGALELRGLMPRVKEDHLFDWSALVRVLGVGVPRSLF